MVTGGQNLNFLAVFEHAKADTALSLSRLVEREHGDRQSINEGSVEPSGVSVRRSVRGVGGRVTVETAGPSDVKEDEGGDEGDEEKEDDEEEGSAMDLEVVVFELGEVPVERVGVM
ncbi:hypothetical protein V6N13_055696 [Hibiscus sabdariffa]